MFTIISKIVNWFAIQIDRLVSVWWGTLVINRLMWEDTMNTIIIFCNIDLVLSDSCLKPTFICLHKKCYGNRVDSKVLFKLWLVDAPKKASFRGCLRTIPTNKPRWNRRGNVRFHVVSTWNPRGGLRTTFVRFNWILQKFSFPIHRIEKYLLVFCFTVTPKVLEISELATGGVL